MYYCSREQYDREQALDDFKTGRARILIATDVASRGLDIKDVTYVTGAIYPLSRFLCCFVLNKLNLVS